MTTPNPWTIVPASDYERHLGPDALDQLAPLAGLFQEAYLATQPDRVLVLGCATGNGLDAIDPGVTQRVVGVDVNLQYLGVARQRFFHLGAKLELFCSEAEKFRSAPESFDLVSAALIFEYASPQLLVPRIAEWLAPKGTCAVVLQLPGGEAPPPPSKAMAIIEKAARSVDPAELSALFERSGLAARRARTVPLKGGKSFWTALFSRTAAK
jgi:SAM-dependent methyltransferase